MSRLDVLNIDDVENGNDHLIYEIQIQRLSINRTQQLLNDELKWMKIVQLLFNDKLYRIHQFDSNDA